MIEEHLNRFEDSSAQKGGGLPFPRVFWGGSLRWTVLSELFKVSICTFMLMLSIYEFRRQHRARLRVMDSSQNRWGRTLHREPRFSSWALNPSLWLWLFPTAASGITGKWSTISPSVHIQFEIYSCVLSIFIFIFIFFSVLNIPLWASETVIIITVKKLQLTGWKPGALKAAVQTGTQRRWTAWIALKYQHCCLNTATKTIPSTKRWGPTWEAFAVGTWRSPG